MNRQVFCLLLLISSTLGCASTKTWSYAPEPRKSIAPVANFSVAVLPFQDRRDNINRDLTALYLIPLSPFGWADYATPEGPQAHITSGLWQFRPADDFARAVAEEVENARIFKETFVSNRASDGDFVLMGEIISTKYEGRIISYGLSVYGPLLWFVGFPAATTSNQLEIHLKLARSPSDPPLWSHTIRAGASNTSWLYVMKPDFQYDTLLKEGLREALPLLQNAARDITARATADQQEAEANRP